MEQCPICKGEWDIKDIYQGWLAEDLMTWLCSEDCRNKYNEGNIERDMPEEFEPPDYLDDPEEEETEEDDESEDE